MKIIRLKLTAAQMAVILSIEQLYDFDSEIENQIAKIVQKYPGGISNNCQDVFEIVIRIEDVEDFLSIIVSAINDDDLKEIRKNMISFESELRILIKNAEIESISNLCKIVVILGDFKPSDLLLQKLENQKIEVMTVKTVEKTQDIVYKKKENNPNAKLIFLLITDKETDNRLIENIYYILLDSSEKELIVSKMVGDDIPSKIPYPIDRYFENEEEIDFSSLDTTEDPDLDEEIGEDNQDEDRYYW